MHFVSSRARGAKEKKNYQNNININNNYYYYRSVIEANDQQPTKEFYHKVTPFLVYKSPLKNKRLFPSFAFDEKEYQPTVSSCWARFLALGGMPDDTRIEILGAMSDQIFAHVPKHRNVFLEFIKHSFQKGNQFSLYALESLFKLVTEDNLDYPQFFEHLYASLNSFMFYSKIRARYSKVFSLIMTAA